MARFCKYCGKPIHEDARFCKSCGRPLTRQISASHTASSQIQEPLQQAANIPKLRELVATGSAGEVDLGELSFPGLSDVTKQTSKVLSPIAGLFHAAGSLLGGFFNILKKPSALIGTLILAALWFVLAQFRDSDSEVVKILSRLTYAEGGFDRSMLGTVGGVLGKGTVAAALMSLFTGGLKNLFKGIGAIFTGHGEKRGIFTIIIGIVIGGLVYFVFVGKNVSADTAMAGIAGAMLSLEALGCGSGKLYELAQSLTSRARNGIRTAERGKCDGLLTGLTIGFTLATALAATGVLEGLL